MPDPVTVTLGALAASALAMAGEAVLKGAVSEGVKDTYKAIKDRVARWTGADVEAPEQTQAVVAEVIDAQPADEQVPLRALVEQLIAALKQHRPVGLDIGRLDDMQVRLGSITETRAQRYQSNIPALRLPFLGRDDLLGEIASTLGNPDTDNVLVLHGPPGVGKSELAQEFARRHRGDYPGGTFVVDCTAGTEAIELARIGRISLGLDFTNLPLPDQALSTIYAFGQSQWLLILDNIQSADAVRPWLPPDGMPCHVLMTTLLEGLDGYWRAITVPPLSDTVSRQLVEQLAGAEPAARHGEQLVKHAGGLPVQLVPQSLTLKKAVRRGRAFAGAVADETIRSFRGVYDPIDPQARLLLHAAARLNTQRIVASELALQLAEGAGWSGTEFTQHLDTCLDVHVLDGVGELRMHQLFAAFVRDTPLAPELAELLTRVIRAQARRMVEIAVEVAAAPDRSDLAGTLMSYPVDRGLWNDHEAALSAEDGGEVGKALIQIGQFAVARPWCMRATAEAEKGDGHGRVDHDSLGSSLHLVGYCLSSSGAFAAARLWYERAVKEKERGDVDGRVDHASLGISLHQVGYCLAASGEQAAARPWFERAVEDHEKGDVHGRIDHASLGASLHQVGMCLSRSREFAAARPWFERAAAVAEHVDGHGRVDHVSVGSSLHQVGYCLASSGEFTAARPWFERAAAEKAKGDIHGRVDHDSLGRSLHGMGDCVWESGEFAAARLWFERAVAEAERGDIHGRVDHATLGRSLHQVGKCLASSDGFAAARPWFERAVAAKEKGDIHGRVDHESLERSRRALRGEV